MNWVHICCSFSSFFLRRGSLPDKPILSSQGISVSVPFSSEEDRYIKNIHTSETFAYEGFSSFFLRRGSLLRWNPWSHHRWWEFQFLFPPKRIVTHCVNGNGSNGWSNGFSSFFLRRGSLQKAQAKRRAEQSSNVSVPFSSEEDRYWKQSLGSISCKLKFQFLFPPKRIVTWSFRRRIRSSYCVSVPFSSEEDRYKKKYFPEFLFHDGCFSSFFLRRGSLHQRMYTLLVPPRRGD